MTLPPYIEVVVVSFPKGCVWTNAGHRLPITGYYDEYNDATWDFREAVTFVAGAGNYWYSGKVSDWQAVTFH